MDMNYNTYGDEDNEFEQSTDSGFTNKREQFRSEFNTYLDEWNNC